MTELDLIRDSVLGYDFAVGVMRLRAVVRGDVLPRLHEPVDLVLLASTIVTREGGDAVAAPGGPTGRVERGPAGETP